MKTMHSKGKTFKRLFIAVIVTSLLSGNTIHAQNVGIGASSFTPASSAMLDVTSTSKGLLIPRMTSAQRTAISAPAEGLLVYETTTDQFYYYDGAAWKPILSGAAGWSTTGNAGTSATTNFIGTTDAVDFVMRANNTERARIKSSTGYVGIGTTSPSQMLSVWKGMNVDQENVNQGDLNNALRFGSGNGVGIASQRIAGTGNNLYGLDFYTNSAWRMSIAYSTGYVGIGTQTPSQMLTVTEGLSIDDNNANNGTLTNALRFGNSSSDEGIGSKRTAGGNQWGLDFYTAGNNRMCINSSGVVGIGTTAPAATRLHVDDPSSGTRRVAIFQNGSSTGTEIQIGSVEYTHDYSNTTDFTNSTATFGLSINYGSSSSFDLQLANNSAAKPSGGSWTMPSDGRLKEDIHSFKDGLEVLRQINPVYYKYNGKAKMPREYAIGVIAQEIKEVAPYTISTFEFLPDENDINSLEQYYSYNPDALHYISLNAIKELDEKQQKMESVHKNISDFGISNLSAGETFISFNNEFKSNLNDSVVPVVTMTPLNSNAALSIISQNADGFVVRMSPSGQTVKINWIAMAQMKEKTFESQKKFTQNERQDMLNKVKIRPASIRDKYMHEMEALKQRNASRESNR